MTAPARIRPLPASDGSASAIRLHYGSTVADDRKRKGGRVTPKGGETGETGASGSTGAGSSRAKPDPNAPMGQVGKRPSPPIFLLLVGFAWIICGVVALFVIKQAWRIAIGVVFIGIGLFWMRGAMATYARHEERYKEG
jgi:hypothetical protein